MQKNLNSSFLNAAKKPVLSPFNKSMYMSDPNGEIDNEIIKKQIEVLEEAIKEYERLEDIKKFTKLALEEIDNVTEDDILRAVELEEKISIVDDLAVKKLLQSEGLINDIFDI